MADVAVAVMELAREGILRERNGRGLVDVLEELPTFMQLLSAELTRLAEFAAEKLHDKELHDRIADVAADARTVQDLAQDEAARFRKVNAFWLNDPDRDPGGAGGSGIDAMTEALGPGLVPEDGTELTGTMECLPPLITSLAGQLRMIAEWSGEAGDAVTSEEVGAIAAAAESLAEAAVLAEGLYFTTYEFWITTG
jgi:hypothetical protein